MRKHEGDLMGKRLRSLRFLSGATVLVGAGMTAPPASAREAVTGQCGVSAGNVQTWNINSDATLSVSQVPSGDRRVARFRFYGSDIDATTWGWDHYQYRYQVGGGYSFGPQSNEYVEFRVAQDPPRSGELWDYYDSADDHNSNLDDAQIEWMVNGAHWSPAGRTEIWVRAIFDVPNDPDPDCWTNALAKK